MSHTGIMERIRIAGAFGLFFAVLAGAASSAQSAPESGKVQWSPSLGLKSLAGIDVRLHQPFGDVFEGQVHGKPITVSNCAEYLNVLHEGFAVTGGEQAGVVLHNDAVDCVALAALQKAKPAAMSHLNNFHLNAEALSQLPPELAGIVSNERIEQAKAADEAGKSWQQFRPAARATAGKQTGQLNVREPGWLIRLAEYARADFAGDGSEQLLLRADYTAIGGTYRNSRLFLLSRKSDDGRVNLSKELTIQ